MGFADDLINKKKKREEESDFVNQVISGNYKVGKINVEPDFSGFKSVTQKNKVTLPTTSKKQTTNVIQPTITTKTNRANELQNLLSERNSTIYSPKTRTNSLNNSALGITLQPNKLDEARQQAEELKNYSKNDEINKIARENYEDKGMKVLETTLKTTGNAITNLGHGAGKAVENFYDFSLNASNNVNTALEEAFGIKSKEEAAKSRQKAADIIKRDLVTEAENKLGWTDELRNEWEKNSLIKRNNIGGQVFQGIGQMLPTIFVGNAMGGLPSNATKVQKLISSIPTTETLGVSSYGSALEEAYNEGATTSQANKYALGSMLTEVTTEWLTGGVPGVNNSGILDNLEEKTLDKVSNNMAKFLIKEGYNVVGEGSEEALAEIIKPYLKNATYTQGQKVNWNDVLQSAIVGGITGGVLDAPGNIAEYNRNQAQTPAQQVIQQQEQTKAQLLSQQRQQTSPIQEKTTLDNINIPTTENVAENTQNLGQLKQEVNNKTQEIRQELNNMNQRNIPTTGTKGMNLQESTARYNINPNNEAITLTQQLFSNRGIESRFDGTLPQFKDSSVAGIWSKDANGNRSVILNPYASEDTVIENLALHELTHDLMSSENSKNTLKADDLIKYVETLEGYKEARQSLEETYSNMYKNGEDFKSLVDEEVVADVLGKKLGNQEFISKLVNSKPSIAKKIYNWVVDKLNTLINSGGNIRSQRLYWENVKNRFETAYNQEYKNNENPTSNPDIRYSLNKDAIRDLAKKIDYSPSMLEANLGETEYDVKRYLTKYTGLVKQYMESNNIKIEPAMKSTGLEKISQAEKDFIKNNDITVEKLAKDKKLLNEYLELERKDMLDKGLSENIVNGVIKQLQESYNLVEENYPLPFSLRRYDEDFNKIKNNIIEEIDEVETDKKIQKEVVESNKFQKYLDNLIKPLFYKESHTVEEVMEEAKYNHGITDDYSTGAYMTTDGELLNFNEHGYRDDHRTIDAFDLDMKEFMDYGAIRMQPEGNGFQISIEPTQAQYNRLEDYIDNYLKSNDDKIYVDCGNAGEIYNANTPTSKIISDIKTYFKTGTYPKQSKYAEFYSKQNKSWKEFVNKHFESKGTTTKLGDIKLPTKKETTLPSKTTTEVKTTPSEAKIPVKESVTTKVEEKPKVVSKLSTEEAKELKTLNEIDDAFGLEPEEEARKQFLEKKQQGYVERFPGLKKVKDFKEISRDYGKYKDLSNFDNKLLKEAEGIVPSYRDTGRRTKEQWLEVAKYIGNNFKGNSSENLTKYAIQSWFEAQPNQKGTLNRQGSKYVDFKIQDWINEVYDGARIGELEKPLVPTTQVVQPKKEVTSIPMAKNNDVLKVESKNIAKQINETGGFNLKQRSWAETSTESDVLKGKVLIEDLDPGKLNYVVQSNKKSLDTANRHINTYGYEKSLADVKSMLRSDGLPKASDVALMQRMIQEATKRGDYATAQDLIMDTAILGTDLGQATQALSMIKRLTPEGQLTMYTKLVERAKARGEKSFQNVEITPEMVQNILEAYNKDGTYNQDDLNARVEKFKQDLADQMKSTLGDKIDAWRYLSMLGNPKTHIRNMVSNIAMTGTIKVKNAMARTLETLLPVKERTKTWKASSKDVKEFSKQTAINMKDIITGEAKYNEKSAIESKKQIFKNKALEKLSNFNSNALEAEDWFFSKRAFQSTLQEYLTANGIETYEDIKNNPELVEKAKNYAREQAEIATFRQYSKLASTINNLERKNKGARLAIQALVPFKKTPINVAKAGVNYSLLGLSKTIGYDTFQLMNGNINASQYIDNLSQGMTGTSLMILGYALAKAGILSGSGGDDKEDKYDSQLGNTGYSINVGGKSYSISWLSPVAMPMLVGANAYEQLEEGKDWDMNVVSDSLAKTLDPLNEMSFMQGITNALNSYSSGVDKWKGIAESTVQNYIGQFFPTLFSQIASTTDDTKRSTKASSNSTYKFGEQTVRSIMYKIPGLRQQLEPATDIWGNEKKQSENILERAFESFLAPYSKAKDISTNLDKEIKRVYNETGDKGVIPSIPYGYTKYDGETYRMSAKEYTEYKKTYGNTANTTLNSLINSSDYKEATEEEKAKMIDNVYDYARAKANEEYFQGVDGVNYSNKTLEKIDSLNDMFGISASTYYANKKEYDYAYQYPEKYTTITQIAPYDKYTKYKDEIDDIRSNTSNDKEETINYINSLNMSVPQKAMFIKQYYKSFKQYDNEIVEYINSKKLTTKQKEQVLGNLGFTIKDGRVYY